VRILVVDDEPKMCVLLAESLKRKGHTVRAAHSGQQALDQLVKEPADLVFTDLRMVPMDGLTLLRHVRDEHPRTHVVMMTGHGGVKEAVDAMKAGAYDYLQKPLELDEVQLLAQRVGKERDLQDENSRWRQMHDRHVARWEIRGQSPAMGRVHALISRVAPTDATVLIRGESGTGKELTAKAIHRGSKRADRPFVAVNCAAIPETLLESELFGYVKGAFTGADKDKAGLFEMAHTGTIFLDEIAEANAAVQVKLLRALEGRTFIPVGGHREVAVDVRILVATHQNLEQRIADGRFREDLFYRFNVFPLDLPPLRDRLEDLQLLVAHFMGELGRDPAAVDPAVIARLRAYPWPGNVRELRNIVERAHILAGSDPVGLAHILLPSAAAGEELGGREPASLNLDEHEKRLIGIALKRSAGNKTRAAQHLGLTRRALYSRMERLGLPLDETPA
jgi:two-component system response regulator AtoC